jgi:hypothetical protein
MNHGLVATPLTRSDASLLRRLDVPRSRQWVAAAMICGGGFIGLVLTFLSTPLPVCSPTSQCVPDPGEKAVYAAMAAVIVLAFVQRRLAAIAAVGAAGGLLYYNHLHPALAPSAFATITVVAVAVWSVVWAELTNPRRAPVGWKPQREPVPAPKLPVRTAPIGALVGLVLIVLGVAAAFYGQARQASVDSQTRNATVVSVRVIGKPSSFTLRIAYPPGSSSDINVRSTRAYRVSADIPVAVDDAGLRQAVAEPYDGSFFWAYAVGLGLAGIGLIWFSLERTMPRRRLLRRPQPATSVYVRRRNGHVLLFVGEATAADLPFAELPVRDDLMREYAPSLLVTSDSAPVVPHGTNPRMLPPEPAILYGVPIPGRWCTVTIGDLTLSPNGPLRTTQDMLPFGSLHDAAAPPSAAEPPAPSDGSEGADNGNRVGERPLTAEERRRIRPDDAAAAPDHVRYHQLSRLIAYGLILIVAVVAGWAVGLFGRTDGWGRALIAVVVLGLLNYAGWRVWLRPMVAFSGGGVAIRPVWRRPAALAWTSVNRVGRVGGQVWLDVAGTGVVSAEPWPTKFGAGRSPDQLMLALRQARGLHRSSLAVPETATPGDRRDVLLVLALQAVATLAALAWLINT